LKLVLPLIGSVAFVCLFFAVYSVQKDRRNQQNDLARRSETLAASLQEIVEPIFERNAKTADKALQRVVDRFGQRENLKGVAVYDAAGSALAVTPGVGRTFHTIPAVAAEAAKNDKPGGEFQRVSDRPLYIFAAPLHREEKVAGALILV